MAYILRLQIVIAGWECAVGRGGLNRSIDIRISRLRNYREKPAHPPNQEWEKRG